MATGPGVAESSIITAPAREAVGRGSLRGEDERVLRRSLGPTAWAVLADLRLDAMPDDSGSQVVPTSARRVAAHLGIGKDTAARALARPSAVGLLHRHPQGADHAGRFTCGSYELRLAPTMATTPCLPGEDTVRGACPEPAGKEIETAPVSATAPSEVVDAPSLRRRTRAPVRPRAGQLSLLDSTPSTRRRPVERLFAMKRGRYFTIPQAVEAYPGVLSERLIRRLVFERRIAFTYAGRRVILAEADIEDYLEGNRREPPGGRTGAA